MSSVFDRLVRSNHIKNYPSFMKANIHYECMMGSVAYGVSDDTSDIDVYGFCIPPRRIIFPYSYGKVYGFGKKPETFKQFQQHHIIDKGGTDNEYDITIYNIVKFFHLCMDNNPNMVDALFVPERCILHQSQIGVHVREHRKLFLSKKCWHKFKGYAYSQLHKAKTKHAKVFVEHCQKYDIPFDANIKDILSPLAGDDNAVGNMLSIVNKVRQNGHMSKRIETIAEYGYDTKFLYHTVRLLDECEQILEYQDLDLTRSRKFLRAIRNGEFTLDHLEEYFYQKMSQLEELYAKSTLRHSPDEVAIKNLLLECLEMHYGSLNEYNSGDLNEVIHDLGQAQANIELATKKLYGLEMS